jgi:hypothetical protein
VFRRIIAVNIHAAGHAGRYQRGRIRVKEAASTYNAREIEEYIKQFWEENAIYTKTKDLHAGDTDFFFVDGPPLPPATSTSARHGTRSSRTASSGIPA